MISRILDITLLVILFCLAYYVLYIRAEEIKYKDKCFQICSSFLFLTPDDPILHEKMLKEIEECAND